MTRIIVAAAVVEQDGRFLVTRRQAGVHLEGFWEFPGGKCEPAETIEDCLARELREELDVDAAVDGTLLTTVHEYPERIVELHFLRTRIFGEPRPLLGQEMAWVERDGLGALAFPPADAELIDLLLNKR